MRFLFKYATRGRSKWCIETLTTYYKMLSGKHEYLFVLTLDDDDVDMTCRSTLYRLSMFPDLAVYTGEHKNKIDAINDDVPGKDWDVLVVVSDDMIPIAYGFDDVIAQDMEKYFPNLDGALHYDDALFGHNTTITYSIMGKALYDNIGYIYHPDYQSFYCDNEFTAVVRDMKKYQYVDRILVEHQWIGHAGPDDLHKQNDLKGAEDGETFRKRMKKGYPHHSIFEEEKAQ